MLFRDEESDNMSTYWKKDLIRQFQKRDAIEKAFVGLIQEYHRLISNAESALSDNQSLHHKIATLAVENEKLQNLASSGNNSEIESALQKKLNETREELTQNLRIVKEDAVRILELTKELKEFHKDLDQTKHELSSKEIELIKLQSKTDQLEQNVFDLTRTNLLLNDEHQALQLAFAKVQDRQIILEKENNDLIKRWMELKLNAADTLNQQNEVHIKQKQLIVQQQLEEAAKDVRVILPEKTSRAPVPVMFFQGLPQKSFHRISTNDGEVFALKWGTRHNLLASGNDRKIKLWEVNERGCEEIGTLTESNATVMSIDFDREESLLVGASTDFSSRIWSIPDRRLRITLTGHNAKVLSAKFMDPLRVVTGSYDRTVKLWDLRCKACVKTLFAGSSCNDLVTSDGYSIISGHIDKNVRFWDSRADRSTKEICLSGRVTSLDLTRDGKYLLVCIRDSTLKILDLRMNQVFGTITSEGFSVACDWTRAVFSPDGSYIAAGASNHGVYIWNMEGKLETTLKEHSNSVFACAWSPTGTFLASSDKSKNIVLWSS